MNSEEVASLLGQIKDAAAEHKLSPAEYLDLLREQALEDKGSADWLPPLEEALALDTAPVATTASGIAQECLLRLLATNQRLRRFFADLARRSGAVHRNAIRLEASAYERVAAREMGFNPARRAYDQFLTSLAPWRVDPGMTNSEIEGAIGVFLGGRGLPWAWLKRATVGAFTWYVNDLVTEFWTTDIWSRETMRPPRTPLPDDLPTLEFWYWNEADLPTVTEDKSFPGIHIYRGDTMAEARASVQAHVEEVERYLATLERPSRALGAKPNKRRETILRNVAWFYRHVVEGKPILSLARAAFGASEQITLVAEAVAYDRRKDVRDGIRSARRLLEARPFEQPILSLDEYERGRMRL